MSSEEDFSIVIQPEECTLEGVKRQILKCQMQHQQLLNEQKDLVSSRNDQRGLAEQFRKRSDKLRKGLEEDKRCHNKDIETQTMKRDALQLEKDELCREIQRAQAALEELEGDNESLKQKTDVSTAVPERKVMFTGATGKAENTQKFDMTSHIVYPMEGGTALITFEEEIVAQKIIAMMEHKVLLDKDCFITVKARSIQLMVPSHVEMDTEVCPRRILVSNLPKKGSETLLDKLEIHFSKSVNGGGEVEDCDLLHDSGNVVIIFCEKNIAKGLTDKQYHDVKFESKKKHRVKVTPFLNGDITNLKTKLSVCPRTVLLEGIPAVMDQENLQDLLEIHFQKTTNGGGEVDAFLYNPLGQQTLALFEADCPSNRVEPQT
ncbi:interferon-induced 35 kDa protein [Polymixia lowei]